MRNKALIKDFARYVSLSVLGQIALSCYTLADTFFVSAKLGANRLTALNLAFPIFCILNGTGLMIGMGGGTKYSIYRSREEGDKANRIFTNAIYLAALFACLFVAAGVFFSKQIVKFLGADETLLGMTNTYVKVMLLFAPAFLFNNLLQCFVRNDGKPSLSMAAIITGSLSNVLLDYIFIFPLDMGIFGAIFATGLAPVISICVMSPYLITRKNQCHFVKSVPKGIYVKEILSSGVSPFLTEATSGVVMFLFNFIILRISRNIGVAAFGVISVISLVFIAIYTGLSQGVQPMMSSHHGAKNTENVRSVLKYAMLFNILSYMSNKLLGIGNTVASIDELYLFLSNRNAIKYIRNAMKRVRKKESSVFLASQNIEEFLLPDIKEFTKPLFSIPTHHFLFYPGNINAKDYKEALMFKPNEYQLIRFSGQGLAFIAAETNDICSRSSRRNTSQPCSAKQAADNGFIVQENLRIFLRRFVDKVDFLCYHMLSYVKINRNL